MNPALALRTVAELTQTQAADLIGVSPRTWKSWEAGSPMPAKKAQAFRDAVLSKDVDTTPLVEPSQIQVAAQRLKELGRRPVTAHYTEQDPFGQMRLAHLRRVDPDNGEGTDKAKAQTGAQDPAGTDFEPYASENIGDSEIKSLIADLQFGKSAKPEIA